MILFVQTLHESMKHSNPCMHFAGPNVVLVSSQWYCQTAVLAVDTLTGKVVPITPLDRQASYSLAQIAGVQCW